VLQGVSLLDQRLLEQLRRVGLIERPGKLDERRVRADLVALGLGGGGRVEHVGEPPEDDLRDHAGWGASRVSGALRAKKTGEPVGQGHDRQGGIRGPLGRQNAAVAEESRRQPRARPTPPIGSGDVVWIEKPRAKPRPGSVS